MEKEQRDEMMKKIKERKKEMKVVRKIVAIITSIIILLIAIIGISGYFYIKSALKPVDPDSNEEITVEIPLGSSLDKISSILESEGIVKNAKVFKYYTKFNNKSEFQAGTYKLTKSMTLDEIIESLKTGKVHRKPVFTITVPEGLTLEQIAEIVEKKTSYSSEEFMELVTNKEFVNKMITTYPDILTNEVLEENIRYSLEGYLFPATYDFFEENPTLEEIVIPMIEKTNSVLAEYSEAMEAKKMTVHQLLTFSSLLEEEATAQADRETIASVFYNRLEKNMPLQTDPTVLYALGSHKEKVLLEDLKVKSPYNTYENTGLPPGPIANSGKISIEAALNPNNTEFLYFLADKDGKNYFAKTYEEHLKNKEKYIK